MAVNIRRPVDLCGGFWYRHYPSQVPASWAAAVAAAAAWPWRQVGLVPGAAFVSTEGADASVFVGGVDTLPTDGWSFFSATPPRPFSQEGSRTSLGFAAARYADSPAFESDGVVEAVGAFGGGTVVATRTEVLRLPPGDVPGVAVGQSVVRGGPAGTAWQLIRLGPSVPTGDRVAIPASALEGALDGPLVFYAASTAVVTSTAGGRTRARFAIGGPTGRVDAFWTAAEARFATTGYGMAELLDMRATPFGPVSPFDLPPIVSPMEVVCRRILGGNAYALITDYAKFGPNADPSALNDSPAGPAGAVFEFAGGFPSTAAYLSPY